MKKPVLTVTLALLIGLSTTAIAKEASKEKAEKKLSEKEAISYILGTQLGQLSKANDFKVDFELVKKGSEDVLKGNTLAISPEEMQKYQASFQKKGQAKQMEAMRAKADDNKKKGTEYLAKNKKKKGVKVTDSGLQYRVINKGDGKKPTATDTVKVHYKGTLIDGTVFDSSYKREKPSTFNASRVIKGWTEGLQLMKVGAKYEFFIPSEMAYGNNAPPTIGPAQALIFEVELLEILESQAKD